MRQRRAAGVLSVWVIPIRLKLRGHSSASQAYGKKLGSRGTILQVGCPVRNASAGTAGLMN